MSKGIYIYDFELLFLLFIITQLVITIETNFKTVFICNLLKFKKKCEVFHFFFNKIYLPFKTYSLRDIFFQNNHKYALIFLKVHHKFRQFHYFVVVEKNIFEVFDPRPHIVVLGWPSFLNFRFFRHR